MNAVKARNVKNVFGSNPGSPITAWLNMPSPDETNPKNEVAPPKIQNTGVRSAPDEPPAGARSSPSRDDASRGRSRRKNVARAANRPASAIRDHAPATPSFRPFPPTVIAMPKKTPTSTE